MAESGEECGWHVGAASVEAMVQLVKKDKTSSRDKVIASLGLNDKCDVCVVSLLDLIRLVVCLIGQRMWQKNFSPQKTETY